MAEGPGQCGSQTSSRCVRPANTPSCCEGKRKGVRTWDLALGAPGCWELPGVGLLLPVCSGSHSPGLQNPPTPCLQLIVCHYCRGGYKGCFSLSGTANTHMSSDGGGPAGRRAPGLPGCRLGVTHWGAGLGTTRSCKVGAEGELLTRCSAPAAVPLSPLPLAYPWPSQKIPARLHELQVTKTFLRSYLLPAPQRISCQLISPPVTKM